MDRGYSTHSRNLIGDSLEKEDQPVLTQIKKAYWKTKQQLLKSRKKEDEHVVASDAELDSKLELYKQIQLSCIDLLKVILLYQKRLMVLGREENAMGKFLQSHGEEDSTQAGKMMKAVGKSQGFSAQQRVQLRQPLYRLFQEVETFRQQAITDTQLTVQKMEEARTAYRAALLWMKDVSEQLDPDAYNRLEKFKKVQAQVRKAKATFDKYKLDVMQKVDLLAASRSNMFSHALHTYQNSLLLFWKKTSKTMNAVSETFKGFQYYEFNMLKSDLDEATKELAKETASEKSAELLESLLQDTGHDPKTEEDKLIYDIIMSLQEKKPEREEKIVKKKPALVKNELTESRNSDSSTTGLIDFGLDDPFVDDEADDQFGEFQAAMDKETHSYELLGDQEEDKYAALRKDSDDLLDDMFGPDLSAADDLTLPSTFDSSSGDKSFLPADLLDTDLYGLSLQDSDTAIALPEGASAVTSSVPSQNLSRPNPPPYSPALPTDTVPQSEGSVSKPPISTWYNLFADLDPLQDPDAIGKKSHDDSGCA